MQNISDDLSEETWKYAFLLQYRPNEFPVIRLQEHQAVEQDDKKRSSCL